MFRRSQQGHREPNKGGHAVVHKVVLAKMTGSEPLKGCFLPATAIHSELECSARVVTSAAIIAEISLHAFTRHHTSAANTRRLCLLPTPARSSNLRNRREIPCNHGCCYAEKCRRQPRRVHVVRFGSIFLQKAAIEILHQIRAAQLSCVAIVDMNAAINPARRIPRIACGVFRVATSMYPRSGCANPG